VWRLAIRTESWRKQLLGYSTAQQAEALGGAASLTSSRACWRSAARTGLATAGLRRAGRVFLAHEQAHQCR